MVKPKNKHSLSHVRHDPAHCLAPGLFRALKRGERKRSKLDVTYDYGDGVWMLEGGAITNAAFMQAGLVDEVSTVIYPAIDATKESPAIYEAAQEGVFRLSKSAKSTAHAF